MLTSGIYKKISHPYTSLCLWALIWIFFSAAVLWKRFWVSRRIFQVKWRLNNPTGAAVALEVERVVHWLEGLRFDPWFLGFMSKYPQARTPIAPDGCSIGVRVCVDVFRVEILLSCRVKVPTLTRQPLQSDGKMINGLIQHFPRYIDHSESFTRQASIRPFRHIHTRPPLHYAEHRFEETCFEGTCRGRRV